jgi:hypothetical protein
LFKNFSTGYIGWQYRFFGIDSWASLKFKNTVSGYMDWRNLFLGIDFLAYKLRLRKQLSLRVQAAKLDKKLKRKK